MTRHRDRVTGPVKLPIMKPQPFIFALLLFPLAAAAQSPIIGIYRRNLRQHRPHPSTTRRPHSLPAIGPRLALPSTPNCHNEACLRTIGHVFPHTTTWTLVKSGKAVAKVTATTPNSYNTYSEIGVQTIDNPASVAALEPRPAPGQPETIHTILATTLPTLSDPDNWRPSPCASRHPAHPPGLSQTLPPSRQLQRVRQTAIAVASLDYTDDDIYIDALYQSNKDWRLLHVTLGGNRCDGPPEPAFLDHWFVISPGGQVRHIGQSMDLAGAADFAHDGHSALLFSTSNGYRLFYDHFVGQVLATVTHINPRLIHENTTIKPQKNRGNAAAKRRRKIFSSNSTQKIAYQAPERSKPNKQKKI